MEEQVRDILNAFGGSAGMMRQQRRRLPSEFLLFFAAREIFKRDVLDSGAAASVASRLFGQRAVLSRRPPGRAGRCGGMVRMWGGGRKGGLLEPTPRVATNTRGLSGAKVEHG